MASYVIIGFTTPDCTRIRRVYGPVTMEEAIKLNGNIPNGVLIELNEPPLRLDERTKSAKMISIDMINANVG